MQMDMLQSREVFGIGIIVGLWFNAHWEYL
jgi:hypothetical protein